MRRELSLNFPTSSSKSAVQEKKVGDLSGGKRNRLPLAITLMAGSNPRLLDEPANDRDVQTLCALEAALLEFSGCVVVISHDGWFQGHAPRDRGQVVGWGPDRLRAGEAP